MFNKLPEEFWGKDRTLVMTYAHHLEILLKQNERIESVDNDVCVWWINDAAQPSQCWHNKNNQAIFN